MKHVPKQHRALVVLQAIRLAERCAAEHEFVLAGQAETAALEQTRLAHAATGLAVHDWAAQVRGGFDPIFARALAAKVTDRMHHADMAEADAQATTERRLAIEQDWHDKDARARQSDVLLSRSRRSLARRREAVALDILSDRTAQRWSRT